jgi:hypothetical protein
LTAAVGGDARCASRYSLESAAQALASALAAWLAPRKERLYRASRRPEQPAQVKSWDGSRGIAVLAIDGKEVEIPFALSSE